MITETLPLDLGDSVPNLGSPGTRSEPPPESITIAGRTLYPSPVFDTYWRFAAARQEIYEARLSGSPGPWTRDSILKRHRFTNCYRAADRVSQFLIRNVLYCGAQERDEIFFRTLLFKLFNRVSTWRLLTSRLGQVSWDNYNFAGYSHILDDAMAAGTKLYSAAYVMPSPKMGEPRKHSNHLRLLEAMMATGLPAKLANAETMREAFRELRSYPGIGDFLAYQYLIDLNYSTLLSFSEMDFVVAGPGARDGIRKCFGTQATGMEAAIIGYMAAHQEEHFSRLGLRFSGLRGRPLQLIDCQNLFCEVDKYARVAHPGVQGVSGRTRIKQVFRPDLSPQPAWFPPKWGLNC